MIIIAIAFVLLIPTTVFAQPTDRCANLNPGALLMNCDLHGMYLGIPAVVIVGIRKIK